MSDNIEIRVVIITGVSSGLGEATTGDEALMKCPAFCLMMWT